MNTRLKEKSSFCTSFLNSIKRVALSDPYIHSRYVTDSFAYIQSIKFNLKNHSILNQIYDMPAELLNHESMSYCKVLTHIGIKSMEEAEKTI